jgi:two-component system sensor histidine kinase KdpD
MTRLSAGVELHRNWCPLEEVIGAALTGVEKVLDGRRVTTAVPAELPVIYMDDVLIGEVFTNILENAAKYTPAGTPIEISAVENYPNIIITIRDHGPGFAGNEERVFEKFYRGASDNVRGVGLGLTICRTIVERHQGKITAMNRSGGGAVLTIELPVGGVPPAVGALAEGPAT